MSANWFYACRRGKGRRQHWHRFTHPRASSVPQSEGFHRWVSTYHEMGARVGELLIMANTERRDVAT